jgi:hypothetical protein
MKSDELPQGLRASGAGWVSVDSTLPRRQTPHPSTLTRRQTPAQGVASMPGVSRKGGVGTDPFAMISIFDPPQPGFIDLSSDDDEDVDVEMATVAPEVAEDEDPGDVGQCDWCNCGLGEHGAYGALEPRDGGEASWVCEACFEEARGEVIA